MSGNGNERKKGVLEVGVTRAAEILGVGRTTVLDYIHTNRLPGAYRYHGRGWWKIPVADVLALKNGGPEGAPR